MISSGSCANTGYHRKYAIRLLNGPRPEKWQARRERRRGLSYSQEMLALLTAVWRRLLGQYGSRHSCRCGSRGFASATGCSRRSRSSCCRS